MAVLAISLAGAAIGQSVGMASVGWLVGNIIGNLLFAPKPPSTVTEGPRLGDLTVTSSAYGAPIPWGYGTVRQAGNIIWSTSIIEKKNVASQRVGGGKGGGKKATATTITYTYSASFAVAFGEGVAAGVIRIWGDSKLMYDAGGTTDIPESLAGTRFRFYDGNEEQLPDGLEEADKGAGQVPAYRGITRIVFDDLQLANFANRLPNITAEIAYKSTTPQYPMIVWTPINHPQAGRITGGGTLAVDYNRGVFYAVKDTGATGTKALRRIQYRTLVEDRVVLDEDVYTVQNPADFGGMSNLYVGVDGYLYGSGSGGNSRPIVRIDPNSMKEIDAFGVGGSTSTSNTTARFVTITNFGMVSTYGMTGRIDFLVCGGFFNQIGVVSVLDMTYVWGDGMELDESRQIGIAQGEVTEEFGTAYVVGGGLQSGAGESANLGIYKITINAAAAYSAVTGMSTGIDFDKLATIPAGDLIDGASLLQGCVLIGRDPTDGGLVIGINDASGINPNAPRMIKWTEADGVVWNTKVDDYYNAVTSGVPSNQRLGGNIYGWLSGVGGSHPRTIDLRSGEYTTFPSITGANAGWPQAYDYIANSVLFRNGSDGGPAGSVYWKKVFLGKAQAESDTLANIVTDLCVRAGLTPVDIDVSELTDDVAGYIIGRPSSAREAMEMLTQAYFFNGVESDYILKFLKRGGPVDQVMLQPEMMTLDDATGDIWREVRTQEVELPMRINVLYMEQENDYQQAVQMAKRIQNPYPAMASKDQFNLELAMVMDATEAKQIAEKWLYTTWIERSAYENAISWRFMLLDPGDIVEVRLNSGSIFRARVIKAELGSDLTMSMAYLAQEAASYVSQVVGDPGSGLPQQTIPGSAFTKLFLLDVPLLRDMDDTNGIASRAYYFMAGYGTGDWPGALLYKSQDNATFQEAGQTNIEASWGTTVNALGDPDMVFGTDEENALTVFMTTGADNMVSISQLDMLNGGNPAVLIAADGTPEIIQYRDVTENPDGSFTLTGLLRGRRGTDVYAFDHTAGELFLLLEPDAAEALLLGLSELNQTRYYKGVGYNTLFEDADLEVKSNTGRDLKPWAPVHVEGELDTNSDIILTWDRRTRINGALLDGVSDVPLNEETESYSIDIYNALGTAVIRTLTSTTDSVEYQSADIITDFGAPPAQLTVAVYQISAAIGRGFAYVKTIDINP